MASTEPLPRAHDRHARRRPFSTWMKRLANLKSLHTEPNPNGVSQKRTSIPMTVKGKKFGVSRTNNPYPLSSSSAHNGHLSFSTPLSSQRSRHSSLSQSKHSVSISHDSQTHPKSRAPTLATTAETAISDAGHSGAGTSATAAKTDGDRNSTFSSPAPSVRSMTTTLTTVQSAAPILTNTTNNPASATQTYTHTPSQSLSTGTGYNYMNHLSSQPATAVPAHLAPHGHPTTYQSATANNVLTDDASILTLASSSKRRRRNSLDTNASVRALAPASMFGGSRESLPLSVLSGTIIHPTAQGDAASIRDAVRPGLGAERASLISASGIAAPALASERNSYIGTTNTGGKYGGDSASVKSTGFLHGRNDSLSGSIGAGYRGEREMVMVTAPTSPLAEVPPSGMEGLVEEGPGKGVNGDEGVGLRG